MTVRFATAEEIATWDQLVVTNPDGGSIFQTKEFAKIKQANHWTIRFLVVKGVYVLVLERSIPFLGRYWYVPKGPGANSIDDLKPLLADLADFSKKKRVFCIKLESELLKTSSNLQQLRKLNLPLSRAIQAANTVIVDIDRPIDQILASFSPKTRYNIRSAQKAEVTTEIVPASDDNCELFYKMMVETVHGRSHLRDLDYFRKFWQSHNKTGTGIFMFAKAGDEVISTDFVMILGTKAARKDAASVRDHRVRGASALLELKMIEYLKEKGITSYDLYGAPPSDQIKNPDHPYYGFGTFKAGFNSEITDYVGCFDLVIKPVAYRFWVKVGERIAHRLFLYQYHDLYY